MAKKAVVLPIDAWTDAPSAYLKVIGIFFLVILDIKSNEDTSLGSIVSSLLAVSQGTNPTLKENLRPDNKRAFRTDQAF